MALSVRFLDGERAGTTLTFGDDAELVVFGRDEASCHVVFPPGEKQVGRQHCALKRVLGRYRLVIDTEHAVAREDGEDAPRPAHDEQEVDGVAVLRLGPDGPRVRVEVPRPARLGRTVFQGMRRPPAGEVAETAVRTARASRRLVALTLLLLVVAGGAGAWSLLQTRESVRSLTERQGSALAEVRTKVTGLEEQLARMEPGMKEVLRAAARSAYLVLLRRADGTEVQVGTGWVAAPGTLATNAHVAQAHGALAEGEALLCRSSAAPPVDHAVLSAALHPAFERFQRLWDDYAPLRRQGASAFERLHAVAACDVALLRVEGAEGLAPALPLASAEDLAALSSPDPVGFAGYPAEGMAVGGVNVRQPEPTVQVGHVTAVTDFFLGKEVGGGGQLIQHSLPLAGGASGSPVLDARGKVVGVISAANYAFTPFGERLPIAVGVNFAQRADLVRELLEGRAAEGLDERVARWQEDLQQFASGREIERRAFADAGRRVISDLLDQWLGGDGGRRAVELATPTAALGAPDASGRHTVRFTLRGLPAVPRLLVALPAVEADIDLYAFRGGTEEILGSDEQGDWYPAVALPPGAPADLDVTVVGPREGVDVTLHVFRAP